MFFWSSSNVWLVMSLYLPWPDKKLLPETSPAKLAPNPTASTAKWPKLPKNELLKNLQYKIRKWNQKRKRIFVLLRRINLIFNCDLISLIYDQIIKFNWDIFSLHTIQLKWCTICNDTTCHGTCVKLCHFSVSSKFENKKLKFEQNSQTEVFKGWV